MEALHAMSHYILVPMGDGYRSHEEVEDPSVYNLPDEAEIYDSREAFESALADQ